MVLVHLLAAKLVPGSRVGPKHGKPCWCCRPNLEVEMVGLVTDLCERISKSVAAPSPAAVAGMARSNQQSDMPFSKAVSKLEADFRQFIFASRPRFMIKQVGCS